MRQGLALSLLGIAFAFARVCSASAQDVAPRLEVRTADGQTTYYIGQRIPLELSFTGPDNSRYEINTATSDSRDPIGHEKFEVASSSGWADPLETYFGSMMGYGGSFLSGFLKLSPKPFVINLDLNQGVRFDQPGNYSISIESRRVTDVTEKASNPFQREPITLRSNAIRVHIVPAPETWQREKLAAIVTQLSAPPPKPGIPPPDLKIAAADLRFLGTPAAARVLAQHVRDDEPALTWDCMLGLVGLPESVHPAALAAMSELIADPNFPVSSMFLDTMSVLQLTSATPQSQREERQKLTDADWILALQALPTKEGKARAATAQTLSSWQPGPFSAQQRAELARILASSVKDLPIDEQASQLQWNWDSLRANNLLPTLQQMAKTPLKYPQSNESNSYNTRQLKSMALKRWYELDPEGAHDEIMRQIGSPNPSLNADALSFLPDSEKLPQFESLWAEQFMATDDYEREALFAGLLVRFGTGSAVAAVQEKARAQVGNWACEPQNAALAYLLKFQPESARPLIERAIKERGKTGCFSSVLGDISHYVTNPMLTQLALESLDDPDLDVMNGALLYLMNYGDKAVEEPIWNRYVDWSEKWRGRSDKLDGRQAGSIIGSPESGVGENLARALIANQGWLATPDLIARVMARCVGEQMCGQVKQLADRASSTPLSVSTYRSGPNENYEIAQYSAKSLDLLDAKIAQFPRGTRFLLTEASPQNQDQKKLNDQVQALFEKNGMILEHPSNSGSQ